MSELNNELGEEQQYEQGQESFHNGRQLRYNLDNINVPKLFTAIREHKSGGPPKNKLDTFKTLLNQTQNINDIDLNDNGNTLLHVAISKDHEDIVNLLLEEGAKIDIKNKSGESAIDIAHRFGNDGIISQLNRSTILKRKNTKENKPECGFLKKSKTSSSQELEGVEAEENILNTYPASGLKNFLHGNIYQLKLLMLFLKRGLDNNYSFYLATEWDDAEKFDDLIFVYHDNDGKKNYRFVQAKHKLNENDQKITIGDLFTKKKDGEFNLEKYLVSFLKIKKNKKFQDCKIKDFIICTNIGFDLDDLSQDQLTKLRKTYSGKNKGKNVLVEEIITYDNIFVKTGTRYKITCNNDLILHLKQSKEVRKEVDEQLLDKEIHFFFESLVFAVNQPNEVKLGEMLKAEISKEFEDRFDYVGELGQDVYNRFEKKVLDWMKEKEGKFLHGNEIKSFFRESKLRFDTLREIKQNVSIIIKRQLKSYAKMSEIHSHVVKRQSNKQVKDVWFNVNKPSQLFTGRKQELSDLYKKAHRSSDTKTVISQMTCISGLGGIGKTELAKQYIYEHSDDYDNNVVWVNAASEATLIESFRRLAQYKLRINTKNMDDTEKDIKSIVEEVYTFFTKRKSLFIFDNADKSDDLNFFLPLSALRPADNVPYILVTTRNQGWKEGIEIFNLNELKLKDSIEFVKKGLSIERENMSQDQEIETLVKQLQCFPLALHQAVAHIREEKKKVKRRGNKKYTINNYLKDIEDKKELLNSKVFQNFDYNNYTQTTFTTWKTTTDKINDNEFGQLALKILDIIAYLAPDEIPIETFSKLIDDEEVRYIAVELLFRYSMVNFEHGKLNVHRLVQQVTRLKLEKENKKEKIVEETFKLLKESFPYGSDRLPHRTIRQLLPHLEAFLLHIMADWLVEKSEEDRQKIEKEYLDGLLMWMAHEYFELANPRRKRELLERAFKIKEKHYGSDYFEIAITLANLGNAYRALSDSQKRRELLEWALKIKEKHYGSNRFEVALVFANLSITYGDFGDPQKRRELLERAIKIEEKHYGSDHFEVAKVLANLGITYENLGDPQKQKELLERALKIIEKHYGSNHFEVAKVLANLGITYGNLGDPQKQKKLLERALRITEEHYGSDHFEVAKVLENLGITYGDLGDPQKQKELLERAIRIEEKRYCYDHFEVAKVLENLGITYGDLSNPQKQKELLLQALHIFEKHNHPLSIVLKIELDKLGTLHFACQNGNLDMVKTLIEEGANILARNHHDTVLHRAVGGNNGEVIRLILNKIREKDSKNFLKHINVKDTQGDTPLMWAAETGKTNAAIILLEYGVDLNLQNNYGETALHWAAKGGYDTFIQLLLDSKADPNIYDNNKKTPLEVAKGRLTQGSENDNL